MEQKSVITTNLIYLYHVSAVLKQLKKGVLLPTHIYRRNIAKSRSIKRHYKNLVIALINVYIQYSFRRAFALKFA